MKYHQILKEKNNNWIELEKKIESLPTTVERGEVFEQFVFAYFNLNKSLYQITEVYREKDIPLEYKERYKLEKRDSGVDGLIIFENGKSAAYQVKFRVNREIPSYAELSKFWIEGKLTDYNYTIANCYYLTKLSKKNEKHLSILVDELENLNPSFFAELFEFTNSNKVVKIKFSPDQFQKKMINDCVEGFKNHDRGKLLAACGTGKTLAALWITEALKTEKVLFLAPSLALIKQTLEAWNANSNEDFSYLCVCSDKTVSDEAEDDGDITLGDLNVPVTTSVNLISDYINKTNNKKKVIFSTYQSLDVLSKGLSQTSDFSFNIIIFDEAHRTAGAKNSKLFSLALHDQYIKSEKRLFMTATERLVKPWIVKRASEYDRIVFSMDDETIYGPVFHKFNFGDAIENKLISDYRIIVAGVKKSEITALIKANNWLVETGDSPDEHFTSAQNIFRQVLILKSMQEFPMSKIVTFHTDVKKAKQFINGIGSQEISLKMIFEKLWPSLSSSDIYFDHINGTMSAGERKERLDRFQASKFGIISNARCLTEGVDVPIIDSIYFVNPKSSLIDIVQACGRALRKPRTNTYKKPSNGIANIFTNLFQKPNINNEKIAYFIIPMLIPDQSSTENIVNQIDFETLYNLIQSLRDQDQRLCEWIDKLNLEATKGKISSFSKGSESPIVFKLPKEFDLSKFKESLYIKIAEVNADPTTYGYKTKKYGRRERKSNYKRIFKTLGDYSSESYKNNLVNPTIQKFATDNKSLPYSHITINNNNVSHTERLGLLQKGKGDYQLSTLGKKYLNKEISFEELFKNQMLKYYSIETDQNVKRILFPYRACLKLLLNLKTINYIEFVFGIYSMIDSSDESIVEAIEGMTYLRTNYPNIEITNESNREKLLTELNQYFGTNYSITDVWAKKTTVNNQFIYFRNHLALFNNLVSVDQQSIKLLPGKEGELRSLLSKDEPMEKEQDETKLKQMYVAGLLIFVVFNILK